MLKKSLIGLGIFFGLVLTAIVVLPFVIDVDKYRPEIVRIANENINGKLELGKLRLSLWGQVLVKVDGVELYDAKKNKLISVDDAYFHLPFFSLLGGSPALTFQMNQAQVDVVQGKDGKINLLSLVKEKAASSQTTPGSASTSPKTGSTTAKGSVPAEAVALPAMATNARLAVEFRDTKITFVDQASGLKNVIDNFNIVLEDISLSRSMKLAIWADLETTLGKQFELRGPMRIEGVVNPKLNGIEFESVRSVINGNFDKLEIKVPEVFHKDASVPANFELQVEVTPKAITIGKFRVQFHNAKVDVNGNITNEGEGSKDPKQRLKIKISSNQIFFNEWSKLILPLKEFELDGNLGFEANLRGLSDQLNYNADLGFREVSFKGPMMKAKPVLNGQISVKTDQVETLRVSMNAPGFDLVVGGSVKGFEKPDIQMSVSSSGMDLDRLIKFPAPQSASADKESTLAGQSAQVAAKGSGSSSSVSSSGGTAPATDMDKGLDPLRNNPVALGTKFVLDTDIRSIKAYNVVVSNIKSRISFKQLIASIEEFQMGLFEGKISASMQADLKPKAPKYSLNAQVSGLNARKAVESQFAAFKNTIYGIADFKMNGSGSSFNTEPAMKNLDMKGNYSFKDASFVTIDVGKMTTEGLNQAIDRVGQKVPQVKGKGIKKLPNREANYQSISSSFTIKNGVFNMPDFKGRAKKDQGIDINGRTRVGLIDKSLNGDWELVDTYNLTKAKDIHVKAAGSEVKSVLAEPGKPVRFPVTLSGTTENPKYSYTQVGEHLVKVALGNVSGAAKGRVKSEAKKQVQKVLQSQKAQEAVKKAPAPAKKLLKKFGF